MAEPTKEELEARRDAIDAQLERLIKLPNSYSVGSVSVNNAELISALRVERDNLVRAIRALDDGYNAMQGPEIVVV
jgi:hypothetical protein